MKIPNSILWFVVFLFAGPVLHAVESIPLTLEPALFGGQVFADCELLGEKTRCLIDTGANVSSVRESEAALALPTTGTSLYASATGGTVRCRNFILPSLKLGETVTKDLEVTSCPNIDTRTRINIIGLDILAKEPFRMNYGKRNLELNPSTAPRSLLDFQTDNFGHALIPVAVGKGGKPQKEVLAMLDTGAAVTVVDLKFARENPEYFDIISVNDSGRDTHGNKIESVLMISTIYAGEKIIAAEYVMGIDFTAIQKMTNSDVKYILGHNILKNANWYLDYKSKKWSVE